MTVVLLTGDLLAMSRVAGAAARSGVTLLTASTAQQAASLCKSHAVDLLIVDLTTPSLDVAGLVVAVKSVANAAPKTVAFGPHVHEERLAAARDAGCDHVVSRGQFFSQLDAILQR
jgi:DNA-binding response OmpR family regulator